MIKICHIRGEKRYWDGDSPIFKKCYGKKLTFLPTWEKLNNFNFLYYRKQIRDIIIQSIVDSNEYDIICYNDEELREELKQIRDKDIISIHSQDDDDIYLGCPGHKDFKEGIYNAPNLIINSSHQLFQQGNYIDVTPLQLLQAQPQRRQRGTGSCNLIMVGEYFNFKEILNCISIHSFDTRHVLGSFIFNWKNEDKYRVHKNDHQLPIYYLTDPINIEFKHFFSFSYLFRLVADVETLNIEFNSTLRKLFDREFLLIKKCNIKNVVYWNQLKAVYEDFSKKLH